MILHSLRVTHWRNLLNPTEVGPFADGLNVTDENDVEADVSVAIGQGKVNRRSMKHWLNDDAASRMTVARLEARSGKEEIVSWLKEIQSKM